MKRFLGVLMAVVATECIPTMPLEAQVPDTIVVQPESSRTVVIQGAPLPPPPSPDTVYDTVFVEIEMPGTVEWVNPYELGGCTDYHFFGRSFSFPDDPADACEPGDVPPIPEWLQQRIDSVLGELQPPPDTVALGPVEEVLDFAFVGTRLEWTEVDNGGGEPADYDLRIGCPTISWGSASSSAVQLEGSAVGASRVVDVTPQPAPSCEYMMVSYRGTLNQDAVFGPILGPVVASFEEGVVFEELGMMDDLVIEFLNGPYDSIQVGDQFNVIVALRQVGTGQLLSPVQFPNGSRAWIESSWDGEELWAPVGAEVYYDPLAGIHLSTENPDVVGIGDPLELYLLPPDWQENEPLLLRRDDDPDAGLPVA